MEELGRAGAWATFTACGQGLRSHSAPFRPPSPSPKSYSFLPASPQEIPAPARRSPPPAPPCWRRRWRGRWRGSGRSGKLWRIFSLRETPSLPHSLGPLRFLWLGLRREGLSGGRVRVWLRSSPAGFERRRSTEPDWDWGCKEEGILSQPCQESQSRLGFQAFFFEMSLNRSVPAEGLKSRGLLFPLGSPPPPRFATVGLARAGGCSRGAPLLTPRSGRGRPGCLENASFLALGGSGFRSQDPRLPQAEERPVWGWRPIRATQAPPNPQRDPMRPFFAG